MNRKEGSGRPRSAKIKENTNLIEELISSQVPHKHLAPRKIAEESRIGRLSIRRMIKRRNFLQFKRVKTPEINVGCCNRKYACVMALAEKFQRNTRMIGKTVRQDEKDFPLDVLVNLKNDRVYGERAKPDVADKNLFASTNKMSRKVMLSAAIS